MCCRCAQAVPPRAPLRSPLWTLVPLLSFATRSRVVLSNVFAVVVVVFSLLSFSWSSSLSSTFVVVVFVVFVVVVLFVQTTHAAMKARHKHLEDTLHQTNRELSNAQLAVHNLTKQLEEVRLCATDKQADERTRLLCCVWFCG